MLVVSKDVLEQSWSFCGRLQVRVDSACVVGLFFLENECRFRCVVVYSVNLDVLDPAWFCARTS